MKGIFCVCNICRPSHTIKQRVRSLLDTATSHFTTTMDSNDGSSRTEKICTKEFVMLWHKHIFVRMLKFLLTSDTIDVLLLVYSSFCGRKIILKLCKHTFSYRIYIQFFIYKNLNSLLSPEVLISVDLAMRWNQK